MCARERAYACVLFYLFIFNSAFHFLSVFCSECLSLRLYDSKTTKASSPTLHDILLYNTPLAFRSLNKQQCLFLSIFILYLLQNKKSYFVLFFQEKRNRSCSGKKSTQFDFVCFLLLWSCVCLFVLWYFWISAIHIWCLKVNPPTTLYIWYISLANY